MIQLKSFERAPHLAELKVSYKRRRPSDNGQLKMPWIVSTSVDAVEYLRSVWDKDRLELMEEVILVCLNTQLEVLGWVKVAQGGISTTSVDPRIVFGVALQVAAARVVLAHNHPGGAAAPSPEDRAFTARLRDAGGLLRIELIDHIILTRDCTRRAANRHPSALK
jgi:DNA repair protein RadC